MAKVYSTVQALRNLCLKMTGKETKRRTITGCVQDIADFYETGGGGGALSGPFKIIDVHQDIDLQVPSCMEDIPNGQLPQVHVQVPEDLVAEWGAVSFTKIEFTLDTGKPASVWPVRTYTGGGQSWIRCRVVTAGTQPVHVTHVSVAVMLAHR